MRKNAVSRWQSMVLAWAPEKSRERHAYGSSRSLTGRWRKQHNALMWCARRHVNDAWRPVQIYQVLDSWVAGGFAESRLRSRGPRVIDVSSSTPHESIVLFAPPSTVRLR